MGRVLHIVSSLTLELHSVVILILITAVSVIHSEGVRLTDEVKLQVKEKVHMRLSHRYGEGTIPQYIWYIPFTWLTHIASVIIPVSSIPSIAHKKIYRLCCASMHITKHTYVGDVVLEMQCEPQADSSYHIARCYNPNLGSSHPLARVPPPPPPVPVGDGREKSSRRSKLTTHPQTATTVETQSSHTRSRSLSEPRVTSTAAVNAVHHHSATIRELQVCWIEFVFKRECDVILTILSLLWFSR